MKIKRGRKDDENEGDRETERGRERWNLRKKIPSSFE